MTVARIGSRVIVEVPPEWPADPAPHLRRCLRGLEDGGDGAIGCFVGSQVEPGSARRSKSRSLVMPSVLRGRPAPRRPRRPRAAHASRSGVANGPSRPGCRAVSAISVSGNPMWWCRTKTARCSTVRRRNARSSASRSSMLSERIRSRRPVDRQDPDVRRPRAPTPGLGVARVDEQAPDPGFEAIRVTQGRELAPDGDEGALQGVLGEIVVAQDPRGERIHPVAGHVDQRRERIAIAVLGLDDEVSHHRSLGHDTLVVPHIL